MRITQGDYFLKTQSILTRSNLLKSLTIFAPFVIFFLRKFNTSPSFLAYENKFLWQKSLGLAHGA